MPGTVSGLAVLGLQPAADDHVQLVFDQMIDEPGGGRGVVGGITVSHHVHIGVDLSEHLADDVALAGFGFVTNEGSCGLSELGGPVIGAVVVHPDLGIGELGAKLADHFADGGLLVAAGEQHGDASLLHDHRATAILI